MPSCRPLTAFLLLLLGTTLGAADVDPNATARQQLMQRILCSHFTIGQDAPITWFQDTATNNGCQWDFRVQYLSGGVDWNDAGTGPGTTPPWFFRYTTPAAFVQENVGAMGASAPLMWFTFYNLSQSYNPNGLTYSGSGPAVTAPANAQIPSLMLAYWQLFKQTMQNVATVAPTPVVVQIEPDEWCHILLAGPKTTDSSGINVYHPDQCPVEVGSSGMPELAGLPDNEIGWAQAFKRLRDLYAPTNCLLATNPSGWDYAYSMTGTKMGGYWKTMCANWDLSVFEFDDRDLGCTSSPPFGENCGICGTFANSEQWISEFHAQCGLYVCMWQVPVGNTYFDTCNQTNLHYCSDHIQHLLETYPSDSSFMQAYFNAGCIGWMFNAGQGFQTHVYDDANDGITNPAPITGSEGHTSTSADDDGGFARQCGQAYYAQPMTFTSVTAPYNASDPVALAATSAGGTGGSGNGGTAPSSSSGGHCGLGGGGAALVAIGVAALGLRGARRRRRITPR